MRDRERKAGKGRRKQKDKNSERHKQRKEEYIQRDGVIYTLFNHIVSVY